MQRKAARRRILVADDQADVRTALRMLLKEEGYSVDEADSPGGVLEAMAGAPFDLVLLDLNYTRDTTSGREGLELLDRIRQMDDQLPVVVLTGFGTVELAVDAMRGGARDFVQKPWDNDRLLATVRTQIELVSAVRRGQRLEQENRLLRSAPEVRFIARARTMQSVVEAIDRVAETDASVLITGEHGVGKDVVAGEIHRRSPRHERSFVSINLAALPEHSADSELFGHVRGAFPEAFEDRVGRLELAEGGTLFLSEMCGASDAVQQKLMRFAESGRVERVGSSRVREINARLIAATNADPRAEIEAGRLRADFLYRVNTIEIRIPPLRERRDDILPLAHSALERFSSRYRKSLSGFDADAERLLLEHRWPGNVRELVHAVERGVIRAEGDSVGVVDLGIRREMEEMANIEQMSLDEAEAYLIKRALARCNGQVNLAARELGLSRSGLYRRLEKFGIVREEILAGRA
ncbi:MAG: sigma-54-dependent transcriptional regulator [Phycisphaerales bacterium]